jgi:small subunit ribosomal protein S3
MGQKVNPKGMRIKINSLWESSWYADRKNYAEYLHRDVELRDTLKKKLKGAGIGKIEIHRSNKKVVVNVYTSKPGVIIGKQGESIDKLRDKLGKKFHDQFEINILEVKKPDLNAAIVAANIAAQIEKRISYRRAAKQCIQKVMDAGAKGVKIRVSGRLNGVEISRSEFYKDGNIPLQTFRADIDYAAARSETTYGTLGVKVWIYKGNVYRKVSEMVRGETGAKANAAREIESQTAAARNQNQ